MTTEDEPPDATRVSNWTLATGTKPGAREVYSPPATVERAPSRSTDLEERARV
jgi:hypothetical protein